LYLHGQVGRPLALRISLASSKFIYSIILIFDGTTQQ
jgi:hypothetical protein